MGEAVCTGFGDMVAVGACVGAREVGTLGAAVGTAVGEAVCTSVGEMVTVGACVGDRVAVGARVGALVGFSGPAVGASDTGKGAEDGAFVGAADGAAVTTSVGAAVGEFVGGSVCALPTLLCRSAASTAVRSTLARRIAHTLPPPSRAERGAGRRGGADGEEKGGQ